MIFIMNAKGDVTAAHSESVHRGSHNAGEIILVAPYLGAVRVHIQLPNKTVINAKNMTRISDTSLGTSEDGYPIFVYSLPLDFPITAISGTVTAQYFVSLARYETVEGTETLVTYGEITSNSITFPISKGVPVIKEALPSDLSYIAAVKAALDTLVYNAEQSAAAASTSEQNASTSEQNASTSEQNASTSEQNAKTSEQNAKTSEQNAKTSEQNAKTSEVEVKNLKSQFDANAKAALDAAIKDLRSYADDGDINSIRITPNDIGTDGKYTITLTKGDGRTLSADIDLPLEAIHIANIETIEEDYERKLKITFKDSSIEPIIVTLGDLFQGAGSEVTTAMIKKMIQDLFATETEGLMKMPNLIDEKNTGDGFISSMTWGGVVKKYGVQGSKAMYTIPFRDGTENFSIGAPQKADHATPKYYVDDADTAVNERVTTLVDIVKTIDTDPFLIPVKESEKAYSRVVPAPTPSKLGSPPQIAHINSISGDTVKPRKNIFTPSSQYFGAFSLYVRGGGIIHASYDSLHDDVHDEYNEFYFPITLPPGTWYLNTLFTSKKAIGVSAFFFGDSVPYGATSVTTSKPMECSVIILIDQNVCDGTTYIEGGETDENGEFIPTWGEEISICDRYFYVSVSEYPNGVFGEEDNTEGLVHIPVTKVESFNSIVFNPEDLQQGRYTYNGNRELVFSENSTDRSVTAYLTEGTYTVACYVYNSATDSYTAKPMNLYALVRGLEMDSEFFDYSYSDTFEGTYGTHRKSFGTEGYTFDVFEACDVKLSVWGGDVDWGKMYIVINRGSEPIPITDNKSNTYEIPAEILTRCPDYGKKYTYIDFDKKEFVNEGFDFVLQNVKVSDFLSNFSSSNNGCNVAFNVGKPFIEFVSTDAAYGTAKFGELYGNNSGLAYWVGILNILGFLDAEDLLDDEGKINHDFNRAKWNAALAQFAEYCNKRAEDGNPITFRFKCKNESDFTRTDISDLLTDYEDFKEIEVYEGGTVTLANTPRLPVESTMSFMQPELEV